MTKVDLRDRVTIVTGAGRGIGRAYARLLASRGAAVVVCDPGGDMGGRDPSTAPADAVVAEISEADGRAIACYESVGTADGAERIVAAALGAFGRLDAVVNNAGIVETRPFEEVTPELVSAYLAVHFEGSLFLAQAAWPHLIESGTGRIVNTTSGAMLGMPDMIHYGSAKAAAYGLTRNLAVAGASHNILVNAIAPAAGTRMLERTKGSLPAAMTEKLLKRMPPELIAPVAAYLVSANCRITGEVINAGGGSVSRMVVVNTPGIRDPDLTPEAVGERLDEILDIEGAKPANLMTTKSGQNGASRAPRSTAAHASGSRAD